MRKLSEQEHIDLAHFLKGLVVDDSYGVILEHLDFLITTKSEQNDKCREENGWDRGYVTGLRDARRIPFDIIETCGTDQDTSDT